MNKLFTLRSLISWILLLIALSALVSGLKEGVRNTQNAEFFPVAAFAVTLSYMLGFSKWTARRAWIAILLSGLLFIFVESARLIEPLKIILRAIPKFEVDFLRWLFQKENAKIIFPEPSVFQAQFTQISTKADMLISRLLSGKIKHASVREFIWDVPLLFISAWAGWGISRRGQILLALIPLLAIHAHVLYYTGKDTLSLQINILALILLFGIHQKWGVVSEKNESTDRAAIETYSALLILSIAIAALAGFAPSTSIKDAEQSLTQNSLAKSLGLEREIPQAYVASGLPRQHLIGLAPSLSKRIVFTVKTGELAASENAIIKEAVPRHYWRWLTYDVYNGQGWKTSPTENKSYSANVPILPVNPQYKIIHQQVEKSSAKDNRLYWTGSLITANQSFNASWRTSPGADPLVTDMLGAITERQSYQADSFVPIISANQLRGSAKGYPKEVHKYMLLPRSIPQRVIDLARELTANDNNPYDKAKAIESYLRTYPYSLKIPLTPPNRDIADYFLFDLKTGYCDYYATSMIVLARAVRIPARLVIGYSNGTYDPLKAEYIIREENAHSWVEVYFTGIGWVEFEPTASEPPVTLSEDLPNENLPSTTPFGISAEHLVGGYTKGDGFIQKNARLLSLGFIFTGIFSMAWFLYAQGFLRSHQTIGSIYEYIYHHGKKIYKDALLHETPSIFAEKLKLRLGTGRPWLISASDEINLLTNLYLQETYSANPITKDERKAARIIWGKLFWRLLYARVRHFSRIPSHAD